MKFILLETNNQLSDTTRRIYLNPESIAFYTENKKTQKIALTLTSGAEIEVSISLEDWEKSLGVPQSKRTEKKEESSDD